VKKAYPKAYFEWYAYYSLESWLGDRYRNCHKSEAPDFQNYIDSLGIEVTRAMTPEEGFTWFFANENIGRDKNKIPKELLDRFRGQIYFDHNNRMKMISKNRGLLSTRKDILIVIDAVETKLHKLNKNYKVFSTNALYIFSPLKKEFINNVIKRINDVQSQFENIFRYIFITNNEYLCVINMENGIKVELEINFEGVKDRALSKVGYGEEE
jgi:hypothetical protein